MSDSHRTRTRVPTRAALLERLEARMLLSSTPIGCVDVISRTQIAGWGYNADDGGGAVNIDITLNGVETTITADQDRMDLASYLGSPYHGFSFTMPTLAPGNTSVVVQAVSVSDGASQTLYSGALTNPPPTGAVQIATATRLAGWAYDPDAAGPVSLRLDIDGAAGTPFVANVSRPDIAGPRKFNSTMVGFDISGAFAGHVLELYALDAPSGTPVLLYTNNRKPIGNVEVNNGYVVSGWALDPDNPAASINVRVDIDGVPLAGTPTLAALSRPDLVRAYGSANHGFSIAIPGLRPGTHTIAVYALDGQANSQAPVLLGSKVITDAPPVGKVEVCNSTTLSGWALDPDLPGAAPATVHVYVDEQIYASFAAALPRPDLVKAYGSPNHGFSLDLSALAPGSHAITVTVSDNRVSDQSEVVIFDGFINNHQPIGSFDGVTGNTMYGWAFDPDAPNQAIAVDVYVDGGYVETFNADQPRADLDAYLPAPDHAFTHALPALGFGTHRIDLYAAESQGNVSVLIGTQSVTNNRPVGYLDAATAAAISGWAADYDLPGVSAGIRVYINGALAITATTDVDRPDVAVLGSLATAPGFSAYGFSLALPPLNPGYNQIDVFAVDANNGLLTPLGSSAITV